MTHILNKIFTDSEGIDLLQGFTLNEKVFLAKIRLECLPKEPLLFDVHVPKTYPFLDNGAKSIKFYCTNQRDVIHINDDGSICLITPLSIDFSRRLNLEIKGLKEWATKFYINEEKDEKYDYPIVRYKTSSVYYFTDFKAEIKHGEYGLIRMFQNKAPFAQEYFLVEVGKFKTQLPLPEGNHFSVHEGHFLILENEPVTENRVAIENWSGLNGFVNQRFKQKLMDLKQGKQRPIQLFLGYIIPNTKETHWLVIEINSKDIPVKHVKIGPNYFELELLNFPIIWANAVNISYDRFFGRGAINQQMANAKILLLGCGAIGSSLAKILVRGGCKNIDISDFDMVESGNICRSEYFFTQNRILKTHALMIQLKMISPFFNGISTQISKNNETGVRQKNEELLSNYDFIFDCTSDNELIYYLDKLSLDTTTIINMSISNKAAELVTVIGSKNLSSNLSHFYKSLDKSEEVTFFEGTGCWNPTFQASYFDINSLLNTAIRNINYRLVNGLELNSFILKTKENNGYLNIQIDDY